MRLPDHLLLCDAARYCCMCVISSSPRPGRHNKDASLAKYSGCACPPCSPARAQRHFLRRSRPRQTGCRRSPPSGQILEALRAHFYTPPGIRPGAPLVVVLHGCTQNADRATIIIPAGQSLPIAPASRLLYPEQQHANNPNLCFNWFHPEDTRRNHGEALSIRQMIEAMILAHDLDRSRVFVTGLSAGGAMASVMLATYPEVFAEVASSPASPTAVPLRFPRRSAACTAMARLPTASSGGSCAMRPATPVPGRKSPSGRGSADRTVVPSNAEDIAAQWRSAHKLEAVASRTERREHTLAADLVQCGRRGADRAQHGRGDGPWHAAPETNWAR